MHFQSITLSDNQLDDLKSWLEAQDRVCMFTYPHHSSLLICYILWREIGGPNDDLARFIYDLDYKKKIDRTQLIAEIGHIKGENYPSVRITCPNAGKLKLTIPALYDVTTCNGNKIILSPIKIANYIRENNLEPVIVKEWIMPIVFSTFDPRVDVLSNQLWVLKNNDAFLYSKIVANRQVVFQSMHDVVGHIAGINHDGFAYAATVAQQINHTFDRYFGESGIGNLSSHLIPFIIGLLLDDLAQHPYYHCETRRQAIQILLQVLDNDCIEPKEHMIVREFPSMLNGVLQLARDKQKFSPELFRQETKKMIDEILQLSSPFHFPTYAAT